ncbi:Tfp pilus assembly protein, ATPase PilM [Candidatus Scalindua japonica]|uniref:Tfp pilus assembly protein, ATPase PilM n=1 Tax=Candidatus Scalindua japonica TaxID=1284222 RepID=A0A286TTN3_9BACT|nr:pilus assembly protein PilM [Candidatus Scalindua japonica]GAX59228.1 Tfp pilus assembly protein, ATPase PilM [Candidatus Scalindua japonica]
MFNLKPNYPIAINIGDHSISAIQLKETGYGLGVREWFYQLFEDDFEDVLDNGVLVKILKDMIKNRKFAGRRAIVLVPTKNITSFPIRFKVDEEESIESAIVRESVERVTIPMNEAAIDYTSVCRIGNDGSGDRYNAAVISVKKELIKQYIIMLKQAGINVEVIDYGLLSLVRLHRYLYNAINDSVILCHIGYKESLLSIIGNDSILAQRNIMWGIQPIIKKLEQNLGLTEDSKAAKTLLRKYGLIYENRQNDKNTADTASDIKMDSRIRPTYQVIVPYINKLIHEFQKMIAFFRSEEHNTAIKNIYIYGQGTIIHHLDQFIENSLNIKTELINPLKKISYNDHSTLAEVFDEVPLTLALGMGMRKVKWL